MQDGSPLRFWMKSATRILARLETDEGSDAASSARDVERCLANFPNDPIFSRTYLAPDGATDAKSMQDHLIISVLSTIRDDSSYMLSNNPEGVAIATISPRINEQEATLSAATESKALLGALLLCHIKQPLAFADK